MKFSLRQEATSVGRETSNALPEEYLLEQNHPNPFNPSTRIAFAIPASGHTTLRVFDMLGREVALLFERTAEPGWYEVEFQGQHLSSGVYLYRLESGGSVRTRKMVLLK
jgi:hypothetical protein